MTPPDMTELYAVCEATWPPAACRRVGCWAIRDGQGGGQRVSAATLEGILAAASIPQAEAEMAALGQHPLFMVRDGEDELDAALAARGYVVKDPVSFFVVPVAELAAQELPFMTTFALWEPLAIMKEVWAEAGIGPARLGVMHRAAGPKAAVMGRLNDRVAGVAYVAIHGKTAMLHALEVVPEQRRQKSAVYMMRRAAQWAQDQGADWLSVIVTQANAPANALYSSLGMTIVGHYHYRVRAPKEADSS